MRRVTDKVFWTEPYRTALETRVDAVQGADVTLEQTIFYAFSGGQESDRGTIGGLTVRQARKESQVIFYTLDEDHPLRPGDAVTVAIDWDRRYRLMRLHLAAEIVLELTGRALARITRTGAHIAADKARIDFAWPENIAAYLPQIQAQTQALISTDHEIVSAFSDGDGERRYWRIEGFAQVPCGGTHLRRTGEIGAVTLRRKNPGQGKERIEITVSEP